MAINLVSLIMQFLTPDMIGRITSALGVDRNNTQTAIGAAVPGLLAGLSGVAAQPGGAQKLVDAVTQQTSALGSLANMIAGADRSSLIDKGSQMLSSLLGSRDQTALAGAVGKYAGLGQNTSGSLLGMLAPIVMGTIGQQQGTRSLDAGAVTSLLSSQKDNIAAALPAGFANLLGGTGLLDSLGGAARTATAAAGQTARVTTSAARAIGDTGQRAAAVSLNWLYWLIPLLAIVALLIYFFAKPVEQVVQQGVPTIPSLTVGGLDTGRQVTDSVTNLRTALGRYHRRRLGASGIAKTARGHGPDRQGRRPARAVVTGAAEGARWNGEPADAAAQPAIRQGARDPRRRRAVEADNRRPAGETRVADRLTLQAAIINRRRRAGG